MLATATERKSRTGAGVVLCVHFVDHAGLAASNLSDMTFYHRHCKRIWFDFFKLTMALTKAFDWVFKVERLCGAFSNVGYQAVAA